MDFSQLHIALISNNTERRLHLKLHLQQFQGTLQEINYTEENKNYLPEYSFDLVIFDCVSFENYDFKNILDLRKQPIHKQTPFIFVLAEKDLIHRMEIYKDETSAFIKDPIDKFEFLSAIKNIVSLGFMHKRVYLYDGILENERKLIHSLDQVLKLEELKNLPTVDEFYSHLNLEFVRKLELTMAVEMALYLEYLPQSDSLLFVQFGRNKEDLKKKSIFKITNSGIKKTLFEKSPEIFEGKKLLDPFFQELEEVVGFEILSLLFVPFFFLHKARGAFVCINKIYRRSFTDNDLAQTLIILQKLTFALESVYMKVKKLSSLESIPKNNLQITSAKTESIYRDILKSVAFGLMVFDNNFRIIYLNNFALKILKINAENLKTVQDAIGKESAEILRRQIAQNSFPILRKEMMVNQESKYPLYLGYSIYGFSRDGTGKHYSLTFLEISQTKRLQAEIIRMDRMASLGVLASGIAHEIRNPLAGIKAMAQTLEEELQGDKAKIEYVERIVRQVNRLDALLKSFFSYAKPKRPNPEKCKIPNIVREVLPLLNRQIRDKNIIVKEFYSRDLKHIFVDFNQIQQVIFNLVINAIDAMPDGGELSIKAHMPEETQPVIDRRQRIPKLFSDIFNEIIISDTGVGMEQNVINNIYNPFFTTKSNGTGLGLSIVYQIIREHGGQIEVESEKKKGTTFKILLPVYIASQYEKN